MIIRIFILLLVFGYSFLNQVKAEEENLSQPIPGKYIVKFKDSTGNATEKADKLEKKHGISTEHVYENSFKGANIIVPSGKEKDLANDPDVEQFVQDFTISANAKPSMDGSQSQVIPTGINWVDAELNTTNEGLGTTVAVLDTGIDFKHPDLMVNIFLSRDFSGGGTGGNDNNKSIGGHGTHCAGIIAALDNTIGVLGVGSKIDLVSVKVLDRNGSGSFGGIIAGLDHVTVNANVIGVTNSSFGANGGTNPSQAFLDASALLRAAYQRAANAGVINVVAAGNEAVNVTLNNAVPAMYPEVITVSALDDRDGTTAGDKWASFSNYGLEVDIVAPGVNILSTAIGGGTSSLSGTSFSSPHVAGTVALYIAKNGRPGNGNATLLGSLLDAISKTRSTLLSGEPNDGRIESSSYADGASLQ